MAIETFLAERVHRSSPRKKNS